MFPHILAYLLCVPYLIYDAPGMESEITFEEAFQLLPSTSPTECDLPHFELGGPTTVHARQWVEGYSDFLTKFTHASRLGLSAMGDRKMREASEYIGFLRNINKGAALLATRARLKWNDGDAHDSLADIGSLFSIAHAFKSADNMVGPGTAYIEGNSFLELALDALESFSNTPENARMISGYLTSAAWPYPDLSMIENWVRSNVLFWLEEFNEIDSPGKLDELRIALDAHAFDAKMVESAIRVKQSAITFINHMHSAYELHLRAPVNLDGLETLQSELLLEAGQAADDFEESFGRFLAASAFPFAHRQLKREFDLLERWIKIGGNMPP